MTCSATPLFSIVLVPVPFLCILRPMIPSSLWCRLSIAFLDDLVVSYHWSSHEGPLCTGCPLSPRVPKKLQFPSLNVLQKSRFFSDFFQNGLVCSVLFPAVRQHASIWCQHIGLWLMAIFTEVSENDFVRERHPLSKAVIWSIGLH